ncbi:MAG: cation diffusion facilitator family transporter [Sulfurimonas sp.]|nr:cation diffusion facilitator family transporter [Sulfurimonas sp.]
MEHSHGHNHTHEVQGKNFLITILLNLLITLAQVVGGIFSGSLALLSDALHNFSDVITLIVAWWANKLSGRKNSDVKTFGYRRAEILATLFNASSLVGIGIYLIFESIERVQHPQPIASNIVIYLAILGIVFNALSMFLIKEDSYDNMNVKAVYLHLFTDVMTSVAVLVGGVAMMLYELFWIDSLITIFIAVYIIKSAYSLVYDSVSVLMQFTPKEIELSEVEKIILACESIKNIHHVHIWKLSDKEIMLEAHLDFKEDLALSQSTKIVETLQEELHTHFGITHATFQNEFEREDNKDLVKQECCHV